jgi:transposase
MTGRSGKRQRYGTIIVDLERRHAVDLLPDRTSGTLAAWLRKQPRIEIVARDRSSEYTRAITTAATSATQIADRWHLLYNTRQMVDRWAAGARDRLRKPPPVSDMPSRSRTKVFI